MTHKKTSMLTQKNGIQFSMERKKKVEQLSEACLEKETNGVMIVPSTCRQILCGKHSVTNFQKQKLFWSFGMIKNGLNHFKAISSLNDNNSGKCGTIDVS